MIEENIIIIINLKNNMNNIIINYLFSRDEVSSVMDISMSQQWNRLDESKDRLTEHDFSVCIRWYYWAL